MAKISAVGIKKLNYCDTDLINQYVAKVTEKKVTAQVIKSLLADTNVKEVVNIHQDTWTLEESESSQDSYRNQLTGSVYRMGKKSMGDLTCNFTIGQYDYAHKAEFLGGTVVYAQKKVTTAGKEEMVDDKTQPIGWLRPRGVVEIRKTMIALTEDNQYCILTFVNLSGRETNADGALGIGISGTAMEPIDSDLPMECWFDKTAIDAATLITLP